MLAKKALHTSLFKKSVLILIFFFLTLQAYYFYGIGIAPFPLIASLLIISYSFNKKSSKQILFYSYSLVLLFIISSIWGFFFQLDFYYTNSILGILLGPIILNYSIIFLKNIDINLIHKILFCVLSIHLACFLIQFVAFILLGVNVDFLEFVTGETSRYEAFGAITGLIRPTGVFNEPATYSYYIFILVYFRFLCVNKLMWFDQLALISILFTLSLSGFFLYAFFQFYYWVLYKGNFNSIVFFSILLLIAAYILLVIFEDTINIYLMSRLSEVENDNSINTRFSDGLIYFIQLPIHYLLFGLGIGNYTREISTSASGWMAIVTTFGIFPGAVFLIILAKYLINLKVKFVKIIPMAILLFSTVTPMQVMFWVLLSFFIVDNMNFKLDA
jgi:hypothetical protein